MVKFGVDIGGTTIKIGLFEENGQLLGKCEIPTNTENGGKSIIGDIIKKLDEILQENQLSRTDCKGVGIGLPGPVDNKGMVLGCVNLGWGIFNIEELFSEQFSNIKVKAGNDANVAALGEFAAGAGCDCENMVMVTLGTGVGGGIIIDGRILTGANGAAGEIGHIPVEEHETESCNCGKQGCLEQYASATGIVRVAGRLKEKYPDSILPDDYDAKVVFDCAKAGDALALEAVEILGKYLGAALASVANTVNPEVIVIGGGVSKAGVILTDVVEKHFQKYVFKPCRNVKFVLATLGNDAGIYGASALVG